MAEHVDDPGFWDNRYITNGAGWDLKTPTPAFVSLVKKGEYISPGTLFIPGCGKGYDAVFAAEHGFNVTALDFSEQALLQAKKLAAEKQSDVRFLNQDIFTLDEALIYDYVFEYTTYCAINPARRKDYVEKISSLLKPGGRLIALLFPIDGREGGPPYNIDVEEAFSLFSRYLRLELYSKKIDSVKPRTGREVLHIYKKPELSQR